jgi:exosortase
MSRWVGGALLVAVAWLYAPTATALFREWMTGSDTTYGALLVAIAALVAWNRRARFVSRVRPPHQAVSIVPVLGGLGLYVVGMLGADVYLTRVSFVVVAAGTLLFTAGWTAARVMAAPLVFLLLAIPPPALVVNTVTLPLQLVASQIAEASLMTLGVPVYREGNVLLLPSAALEVAEACSGLRSVVSLGALSVLLAWATENRTTPRVLIVAAAIPVAVLLNGMRVALTGVASEAWGPSVATGSWHTFTGWVTFVAALAVLMLLQRLGHAAARLRPVQPRAVPA